MDYYNYEIEFDPNAFRVEGVSREHIDEALSFVFWQLRQDPYVFGVVPPVIHLRFAKQSVYIGDRFVVPPLIVIFRIKEDEKVVRVLEIRQGRGFGDLNEPEPF